MACENSDGETRPGPSNPFLAHARWAGPPGSRVSNRNRSAGELRSRPAAARQIPGPTGDGSLFAAATAARSRRPPSRSLERPRQSRRSGCGLTATPAKRILRRARSRANAALRIGMPGEWRSSLSLSNEAITTMKGNADFVKRGSHGTSCVPWAFGRQEPGTCPRHKKHAVATSASNHNQSRFLRHVIADSRAVTCCASSSNPFCSQGGAPG